MSENKMKHATPQDGKSKYALKKEAQARGHFLPTSPFQSTRAKDQKEQVKE